MSLVEKALRKLQETGSRPQTVSRAGHSGDGPQMLNGNGDELATRLRAPSIAIDFTALRSAGLLPPQREERQLAQQYRRIKRPLIANALGRGAPNGHLIMLASAMAGEGKTFTALNLALSMSMERDVRVLLVDADVARPHLSNVLGLSDARGLLDVLRDTSLDVEQLIHPTDIANLCVLSAGRPSPEATELLASNRMQEIVAALGGSDHRRIVLFDSPPLLQTTESHPLVHAAGQVVVVVRAEFTPQPVVLDALKLLEGHGAVSLVLNQSVRSATSAYYYYGYGANGAAGSDD